MLSLFFLLLLTEAFVPWTSPPSITLARRGLVGRRRSQAPAAWSDQAVSEYTDENGQWVSSEEYHEGIPPPLPNTDDPFVILGIDPLAASDQAALKSAYHRQAKAYHPDACVSESTPEEIRSRINHDFQMINIAYAELRVRSAMPGESEGIYADDVEMDPFYRTQYEDEDPQWNSGSPMWESEDGYCYRLRVCEETGEWYATTVEGSRIYVDQSGSVNFDLTDAYAESQYEPAQMPRSRFNEVSFQTTSEFREPYFSNERATNLDGSRVYVDQSGLVDFDLTDEFAESQYETVQRPHSNFRRSNAMRYREPSFSNARQSYYSDNYEYDTGYHN